MKGKSFKVKLLKLTFKHISHQSSKKLLPVHPCCFYLCLVVETDEHRTFGHLETVPWNEAARL